jgi:hypothetical protein
MRIPWFKKKELALPFNAVLDQQREEAELDIYSKTWRYIEKWQQEQLNAEREKNDAPRRDAVETAFIRGKIQSLKDLAELGREASRPNDIRHNAGEEEEPWN